MYSNTNTMELFLLDCMSIGLVLGVCLYICSLDHSINPRVPFCPLQHIGLVLALCLYICNLDHSINPRVPFCILQQFLWTSILIITPAPNLCLPQQEVHYRDHTNPKQILELNIMYNYHNS
jgi:hypothetical protein